MSVEWSGFKKLMTGRIHLFCPRCRRKMSNVPRSDYDPRRATLVHTFCPKCGNGGKDAESTFFDAKGKEIPWTEVMRDVDGLTV